MNRINTVDYKCKLKRTPKRRNIFIVLAAVIVFYLMDNLSFIPFRGKPLFQYGIKPLLLLAVTYIIWRFPNLRPAGKIRLHSFINSLALICGGFYIVAMFAGGLFDGLGKSPYSFTPKGIMTNFFFVSTLLIWTEFSRAYLINYWAKKRVFLTLGFVSLLFTFTGLSLHKLITLKFGLELIQYIGEQALPVYAENLMISYLAYLGGPVPALLYHGVLECFHWFSPVLPNLGWMTKTLLGTVIPIVSLILVQQLYLSEARELKKEKENPVGMILTGVTGVLIIWFAVGLFPIYPSVIITGSMEPLIKPGDIVLLKKTDGEKVNINEIIEYRDEKINITHRVIDIKNSEKGKKYQTMGDANGIPDAELVSPEQVRGKVIGVVPKIGYLTLLLRSEKNDVDLQDYGGQEI